MSSIGIVEKPDDLVWYTKVDDKEYPIYLTATKEAWLKAKPKFMFNNRVHYVSPACTFYVKNVAESSCEVKHDLLERAVSVIKEVTKSNPELRKYEIVYEVYSGDMEKLLGEAKAHILLVRTDKTGTLWDKAAWAIAFDWKKRCVARCAELSKYMYVAKYKSSYVALYAKFTVLTNEFIQMFNLAFKSTTVAGTGGVLSDLEEQVKQLTSLIQQKEDELRALETQLQNLLVKLQLERMKAVEVQ